MSVVGLALRRCLPSRLSRIGAVCERPTQQPQHVIKKQAKVQRRIEEGKGKDEEELVRHDEEDDVKEEN